MTSDRSPGDGNYLRKSASFQSEQEPKEAIWLQSHL